MTHRELPPSHTDFSVQSAAEQFEHYTRTVIYHGYCTVGILWEN